MIIIIVAPQFEIKDITSTAKVIITITMISIFIINLD